VDNAFAWTALKNFVVPTSVEEFGNGALSWCNSVESVTFEPPCRLHGLGYRSFTRVGVKAMTIHTLVDEIGRKGFCDCKSLARVTFECGFQVRPIGGRNVALSSPLILIDLFTSRQSTMNSLEIKWYDTESTSS
jgi:hypothetical protein